MTNNPFEHVPTATLVDVVWCMRQALNSQLGARQAGMLNEPMLADFHRQQVACAAAIAELMGRDEVEQVLDMLPWWEEGDDLVWLPVEEKTR